MRRVLRLWRHLVNRSRADDDLDAEVRAIRDVRADEHVGAGSTPAEARRAAAAELGTIEAVKARIREVRPGAALERMARDAAVAARMLRRSPAFTLTALLALAIGIGTVTTAFSIVDTELWKPLPFANAQRLVAVHVVAPSGFGMPAAGPQVTRWRDASRTLSNVAALGSAARRVLRRATAESVRVAAVTANFLATIGVRPELGRAFGDDDRYGTGAAVLTAGGWSRLFNGDPAVLGTSLVIDDTPFTVVGVMTTPRLARLVNVDVIVVIDEGAPGFVDPSRTDLTVVGRLAPGATHTAVAMELSRLMPPAAAADRGAPRVRVWDLAEFVTGNNWRSLYFFLGAALAVLLVSCISVANLLLARALARQREFAIRSALGGGRSTLIRQLLVEGVLLSVPAVLGGLLLTWWALAVISANIPSDYLQHEGAIPLNVRAGAFALSVAVVTTMVFGLVPFVFAGSAAPGASMAHGGRTAGSGPGHARWRRRILTAQIAVTAVLVFGAVLFLQSFALLKQVPLGFSTADRLSLDVSLAGPRYASDGPIRGYAGLLLERARAVPGVGEAAVASSSPLRSGPIVYFDASGGRVPSDDMSRAILRVVSADYFHVVGMPLLAGRAFTAADTAEAPRVAIVNRHLAETLFGSDSPVGRTLVLAEDQRARWTRRPGPVVIVGVVENAREVGINEVAFNDVYLPFAQAPSPHVELLVRTSVPVDAVAGPLRHAAAAVDPALPVAEVSALVDRVDAAFGPDRFNMLVAAAFAAVALVLAAIGVYGVMAYTVAEQTRELGVRLALGARPRQLVVRAVWQAARLGLVGACLGVCLSLGIAYALGSALYLVPGSHNGVLYGVTTTSPAALVIASVLVALIATLSGLAPAQRISRADPLVALRVE